MNNKSFYYGVVMELEKLRDRMEKRCNSESEQLVFVGIMIAISGIDSAIKIIRDVLNARRNV